MTHPNRRDWCLDTGLAAGALAASFCLANAAEKPSPQRKLKVVVAGAHPDDPESSSGGTMARYADLGHEVVSLYLTRGEAGIQGKSHQEAAAKRTAEAQKACELLRVRPVFAGQVDGSSEITPARYDEFRKVIESEKPDVVFTHWPVDTHRDHRAVSLLVYDAWLKMGRKWALYYFEVLTGSQTQCFRPTHFVDISSTEPRKRAACMAHESQNPGGFYAQHEIMSRFRGKECGCKLAEAFVHHEQSPLAILPS